MNGNDENDENGEIRVGDTVEVIRDHSGGHHPEDHTKLLKQGDRVVITHVNVAGQSDIFGYSCPGGGNTRLGNGYNTIRKSFIKKVDVGPPKCICPTHQLMVMGCQCGGT